MVSSIVIHTYQVLSDDAFIPKGARYIPEYGVVVTTKHITDNNFRYARTNQVYVKKVDDWRIEEIDTQLAIVGIYKKGTK